MQEFIDDSESNIEKLHCLDFTPFDQISVTSELPLGISVIPCSVYQEMEEF